MGNIMVDQEFNDTSLQNFKHLKKIFTKGMFYSPTHPSKDNTNKNRFQSDEELESDEEGLAEETDFLI